MLPQAQCWYLINATLGPGAGEGGGVQQKVQCAGESWRRERGGNGGAGSERKKGKVRRVDRSCHLSVDQCWRSWQRCKNRWNIKENERELEPSYVFQPPRSDHLYLKFFLSVSSDAAKLMLNSLWVTVSNVLKQPHQKKKSFSGQWLNHFWFVFKSKMLFTLTRVLSWSSNTSRTDNLRVKRSSQVSFYAFLCNTWTIHFIFSTVFIFYPSCKISGEISRPERRNAAFFRWARLAPRRDPTLM